MDKLDGRRVLLIAPRFFGYERDIKAEIERRGAIVDWLPDRPFDSPAMSALTRMRPGWVQPAATRFYRKLLEGFGATNYDLVLVVNGQTLSAEMLTHLRVAHPRATFVLYMWDALANRAHIQKNLPLFDHLYTFDPRDAKNFGMRMRPLFFGPGFDRVAGSESMKYHLCFIGTAHSDRFPIIDALRRNLPADIKAFWYLYMQAPWVLQFRRFTEPSMRHARREDFEFVSLDKAKMQEEVAGSRAILDIEHPRQYGLTMRTFETLGAGKKLVTTNAGVRDYDFFSRDNVFVIDRNAPMVPRDFLEAPFSPMAEPIRRRYSIAGWLDELIETGSAPASSI